MLENLCIISNDIYKPLTLTRSSRAFISCHFSNFSCNEERVKLRMKSKMGAFCSICSSISIQYFRFSKYYINICKLYIQQRENYLICSLGVILRNRSTDIWLPSLHIIYRSNFYAVFCVQIVPHIFQICVKSCRR